MVRILDKPGLSGPSGLVSCNQTNQTDRTDQMNKKGWRTFSASCLIQRGDGQGHFIRQQKRHVRLVGGVRLNEGK